MPVKNSCYVIIACFCIIFNVFKMACPLEDCTLEDQRAVIRFLIYEVKSHQKHPQEC